MNGDGTHRQRVAIVRSEVQKVTASYHRWKPFLSPNKVQRRWWIDRQFLDFNRLAGAVPYRPSVPGCASWNTPSIFSRGLRESLLGVGGASECRGSVLLRGQRTLSCSLGAFAVSARTDGF